MQTVLSLCFLFNFRYKWERKRCLFYWKIFTIGLEGGGGCRCYSRFSFFDSYIFFDFSTPFVCRLTVVRRLDRSSKMRLLMRPVMYETIGMAHCFLWDLFFTLFFTWSVLRCKPIILNRLYILQSNNPLVRYLTIQRIASLPERFLNSSIIEKCRRITCHTFR